MKRKPLPPGAVIDTPFVPTIDAHNTLQLSSSKFQLPPPYDLVVGAEGDAIQARLTEQYKVSPDPLFAAAGLRSVDHHGEDLVVNERKHYGLDAQTIPVSQDINLALSELIHVQQPVLGNYRQTVDALFDDLNAEEHNPVTQHDQPAENVSCNQETKSSKLVRGLEDASLFLGGLLKRPTESTKHFTILRHGHGLVYYKGPSTSITITVFSDTALPPDRRYWLQSKGWSGNTGMALKAVVRANSTWVNVTPTRRVQNTAVPALDERAWQRDIKNFLVKPSKTTADHVTRETAVLRIPAEAVDGYFRVVMTNRDSRYVLCPSPVFRIASTSTSASSIKGSSLATLPIELGINIMQLAATKAASAFVSPYTATVQQGVKQITPQSVQSYAPTAYSLSGAETLVGSMNEHYESRRSDLTGLLDSKTAQNISTERSDVIGRDEGPGAPYPMIITGTMIKGTGQEFSRLSIVTANLDVGAMHKHMLATGVYFGWVSRKSKGSDEDLLESAWRHALVTVDYGGSEIAQAAAQKVVKVHLLHKLEDLNFPGTKLDLCIMGFLRPIAIYDQGKASEIEMLRDIQIARNSLDREFWTPQHSLLRIKEANKKKTYLERYTEARVAAQRQIDRIPFHRLGVRTESTGLTDRNLFGNGGLCIVRDED